MSKYLFVFGLILTAACFTGPDDNSGAGDGPGVADLGSGGGDGSSLLCVGQTECGCLARRGECVMLGEQCHCPYPQCGPGACLCGGGKYLGCAPQASACPTVVRCRPAGRPGPQDGRGCIDCAYQATCQAAFDQMVGTCEGKRGLLSAFSCSRNPACVTECINNLARCEDIGCGLCAQCGCGSIGPFEQCFNKCTQ